MSDSDLGMLKAVTEQTAQDAAPGGRWDAAEEAVACVLGVLYNTPRAKEMWQDVYDAVKSAYVGKPDWGDEG